MMNKLAEFFLTSGETSLYIFWLPFLIWTVVSLLVLLMLKLIRISQPLYHYHFRLALLFSLPLVYVFSPFISSGLFISSADAVTAIILPVQTVTEGGQAEAFQNSSVNRLMMASGLVYMIALMLAARGSVRLLGSYLALKKFRQKLTPIDKPGLFELLHQTKRSILPGRTIEVYESADITAPLTFGWLRPVIVLPDRQYDEKSLSAVFLHEMIHIRRGDYVLKWIQEIIRAVFAVNPLVSCLSDAVSDYREMSCDAEVLSYKETSPGFYASLLLASVGKPKHINPLYSSMSQSKPKIMKRISVMNTYTSSRTQEKKVRINSLALSGGLAMLVIMASSCNFLAGSDGGQAQETETEQEESGIFMVVSDMPEPEGGIQAIYDNLNYPETARENEIEGRVSVQFTVNEDGTVSDPVILRGIGGGADEEAVRAISQTSWEPGRQRGRPVPVRFVYTIQFRLNSSD